MNLFHLMLKKDGRIGSICWNRARTRRCLGLSRHMLKVTSKSDASNLVLCAVIYIVEYINTKPVSQHRQAGKSRIAPKGQSIPRLELTATVMLAKLQSNLLVSSENYSIKSCHYWVDSRTALYWLLTKGL